ncbi:MAG: hypothetical protein PHW02_07440 [bacterium]|nr:hypothetical protein [bacterium]
MKRLQVIIFSAAVMTVLFFWSLINTQLINKAMTVHSPEIKENVRVLIAGDSHTQTALNPGLMTNAASFTYSNENYFFTYYKLKWALEKNNTVKAVILGFSYHNLSREQERVIKDRTFFLEHNFLLLDSCGRRIVKEKSEDLFNYFRLKYEFGLPLNFYNNDLLMINFASNKKEYAVKIWGGYKNMTTANLTDEHKKKLAVEKNTKNLDSSLLMREYLEKISLMCEKRGITLYLVNTPMHDLYFERYTKKTIDDYLDIADSIKTADKAVYLDFRSYLAEDSFFYDGEHINESGAGIFSEMIDSIVRREESNAI